MTYAAATNSSLGHVPAGERWTFDQSVTQAFDDMLRRSIPQYDVMRRAVFDVGSRFVQPATDIVDLGCARGEALASFLQVYGGANRYVGTDTSGPMLDAARARFDDAIAGGFVTVLDADLRDEYPAVHASLTLCVLTLQFTPVESRQRIVDRIYATTVQGGALILVEKLRGATPCADRLLVENYHAMKAANGYTAEEIERKRLALEGVLVPETARGNERLLAQAGFTHVECFWRWMNFAGWVAVKPDDAPAAANGGGNR
jgi:tRNA (cmo5U34)-methyltransferase